MSTRTFALIFGIVFLAVGALGFVPGMVHMPPMDPHPDVMMPDSYGDLLGLFPVNMLHNVVHILFGLWGIMAYRSLAGARMYFRAVAVIYGLLTLLGLIPSMSTTFGMVPIYGNDVWLHAVLALVAAYFGWMNRDPAGA
jgi:hypothetical protein